MDSMRKRNIIIIMSILMVGLVIIGLYGTFASNSTTLIGDNTYNITLTGNNNEVVVPAGSSKTVYYKITNTNKGVVQYGMAFSGDNIEVKAYNDSQDKVTGNIDYGESRFVKLYITNTGSSDSTAYIQAVLGYENGGSLNQSNIIPSGYSLVNELYYANVTALSDFTYYLGSEYQTVDTINYYDEYAEEYIDVPVPSMALEEDEILLVKYNGTSPNVSVPDTYTVDGITYNVTLLSSVYLFYNDGDIDTDTGIFQGNTTIENVILGNDIKIIMNNGDSIYENDATLLFGGCENLVNVPVIPNSVTNMDATFVACTGLTEAPVIPNSVTDMSSTFFGCTVLKEVPQISNSVTSLFYTFCNCTSLVTAPVIPNSVTNMSNTFYNCTSLVTAPEIPNSVTDMSSTFSGCTGLTEAPVIPSSVTNMGYTFYECTGLTEAPIIPSSVTNMGYTFSRCTGLTEAPIIPSSVTNMNSTFSECTNLTGTVRINSSNVTNVGGIFAGTSKAITVEVPAGSTTYTKLNALTTSNGKPSNVTLTTF